MRDIKFRFWNKSTGTMSIPYTLEEIRRFRPWSFVGYEDMEIMQYTGLKDKNGVEIYEGDILKKKDTLRPFVVGFHENTGQFKMYWERMDVYRSSIYPTVQVEVIGNIYENPELLEVK